MGDLRALPPLLALLFSLPGDSAWRDPGALRTIGLPALGEEGDPPARSAGRTVFLLGTSLGPS
ncbi:MAG: hypothetical protein L0323_17055, partial [Planctomycetes bacterium]|nr:hypothetical protein [Planctomycetota bacterium]